MFRGLHDRKSKATSSWKACGTASALLITKVFSCPVVTAILETLMADCDQNLGAACRVTVYKIGRKV